jgi:PAS domain S-box-containing protein
MDKTRFQKVLRRAFLVPLGIAILVAATLIVEVNVLSERAAWVEHTDKVIQVAQHLYRVRIDQESALRAYLLTMDSRFLQPFEDGRYEGSRLEAQLQQLISDNPSQQEANERAARAFADWSTFADGAIALAKAGDDVGDPSFQLRGKQFMDQYQKTRADFAAGEERLREERLARSRTSLRVLHVSVVSLCLLIGLIAAILGYSQLTSLSQAFSAALDLAQANAAEAQSQKDWFHTTLNSIGDAVIATDKSGVITFMNAVAQKLTGWDLHDAMGKSLTDVFRILDEQTRETVENPIEKVRRLQRVVGLANHTILIAKSGQELAIDDSGAPIFDASGAIAGIVLVFRDVTQQRDLEAALQSNERLAVAGRLSASIAHEIHNPLDTAGNLLFLISQQTRNQPELQQLIGAAEREVHRVAEISRNMLSLHREARAAIPIKLGELLDGVVALIEDTIAKGRRKIHVEHGFEGEIRGFPAELRQVFTNVIKNAVDATGEGGSIRIFSVAAQEAGRDGVLVHVADNGGGIPEDMRNRLFNPFASTKQEGGSGLGLWVSRSILEKHGGAIRVVSGTDAANRGTTVTVFLPLEAVPRGKNGYATAPA